MPELPEVERARRVLERVAVGRRIVAATCADDRIVFEGVAPAAFAAALQDRRVLAVERRGKHFWCRLDTPPHPLFHLGMTGHVRVPGETALRLQSSASDEPDAWPPRFTKLRLRFDDGGEVAITNARRLGRIRLRDDPAREPPVSELGFDPMIDPPSGSELQALLARRRGPIKSTLLDQTLIAGVGNWIADEVLFQAGIDPRRPAAELDVAECRRLHRRLRSVVQRACAVDADSERFPRSWLFHRRWGRVKGTRTLRGDAVEFIEVGGRTTAWVPAVQR